MLAPMGLTPQQALICTMVLVGAADGEMTDREIGVMSASVQTVPAFQGMTSEELKQAMDVTVALMKEEDGLTRATMLICDALPPDLRETAYLLGCDVAAADNFAVQLELRMLEFLAGELRLTVEVTQALERAAQVRCRVPSKS